MAKIIQIIVAWFGPRHLSISHLAESLHFHERRYSPYRDMVAIEHPFGVAITKPGMYVGLGKRIIKERRKRARLQYESTATK